MAASPRSLRGLKALTRSAIVLTSPRRPFTSTDLLRLPPYKDDQDRHSLKPRATEYSKSGSDEQAAAMREAAFDPSKTRPEEAKRASAAGGNEEGNSNSSGGKGGDPLEVSPANKEVAEGGTKGGEESKAGKAK